MSISEIAVRRPITTIMFFSAFVMLGIVSLNRLPLLLLPDSPPSTAAVRYDFEVDRNHDEVERDLLIPVEGAISQLEGVEYIRSTYSRRGWGGRSIMVDFHEDTDIYYAAVDLQDRLDAIRGNFEEGDVRFRVSVWENSRLNNEPIEIDFTGPVSDPFFDGVDLEDIRMKLIQIDGVSDADTWGEVDRVIDVAVDQNRLREYGLSLNQVTRQVRNYANEPIVVGEIQDQGQRHFVRFDGQFTSTAEIDDVMVRPDSNLSVRHLGTTQERIGDRDRIYMSWGRPAVNYDLQMEAGQNPIELSRRVRANLDSLNAELPPGYEFIIKNDQATGIIGLITLLSSTAAIGVMLAMVVLFLFIRNWRMTSVICFVIPVCVISSFNFIYFSGMTLNAVTLIGLAVGVGSLIDNSIVVMENIYRHYQRGEGPIQSAIKGAKEVAWAIAALTVTGTIVFLPILFADSNAQPGRGFNLLQFFEQGAMAIIFPILISMLVALMIVPMASARFLRFSSDKHRNLNRIRKGPEDDDAAAMATGFLPRFSLFSFKPKWMSIEVLKWKYLGLLKTCLRYRYQMLIGIILFCLYTMFYTWNDVSRNIMSEPENDTHFEVHAEMPPGSTLDNTMVVAERLKEILEREIPEARFITARVEEDDAEFDITLIEQHERDRSADTIRDELRPFLENFAGADVGFWRRWIDPGEESPVQSGRGGRIEIRGPEHGRLQQVAENFSLILQQNEDIIDAYGENQADQIQYQFRIDRENASLFQITPSDIAEAIRVAQRRNDFSTVQLNKDDYEIDIVFSQIPSDDKEALENEDARRGLTEEELKEVPVYSAALDQVIELDKLGTFDIRAEMGSITRENRERITRIRYVTAPQSDFRTIENEIRNLIDTYPLPAGYRMSLDGSSREWDNNMSSVWFVLGLGLVLIYMCLAALFESFTMPLVIMLSIPLAVIGVVWFLILTETPFEPMMSGLGAIFLLGILPNSAILFVYTARTMRRDKGYSLNHATLGAAFQRLRPILMTVTTTILGLLPLAVSPDSVSLWGGWRFNINLDWVAFARVVIGGLLSSTILTLLVVPSFYYVIHDVQALFSWIKNGIVAMVVYASRYALGTLKPGESLFPTHTPKVSLEAHHLTRHYAPPFTDRLWHGFMQVIPSSPMKEVPVGFLPNSLHPHDQDAGSGKLVVALKGVSFSLEPGVYGLLGPNGAGKTTLLRALAGIDQPTRGSVFVCGYDLAKRPGKARKYIAYLPQFFGLYSNMTGRGYLTYVSMLKGIRHWLQRTSQVDELLEYVNLTDEADRPVHTYSAGMQRRLGLAQLLLNNPRILFVDEPTADLDIAERIRFRNLLTKLGQDRVVLFSTHNVEDVAHACSVMLVLNAGQIVYEGEVNEFTKRAQGKVWQVRGAEEQEWQALRRENRVSSMKKTPDGIDMRVLQSDSPHPGAEPVPPTLEEAYLLSHMKS